MSKENIGKQTDRQLSENMCTILIVSFRRYNIIMDVTSTNNHQYNSVIVKCNSKLKIKLS
jgi:hypothetical protein